MAEFASRYAQALAEVVEAANLKTAEIQSQLKDFTETLAQSADLREMLDNPSFPAEQKIKVLDAICAKTQYAKPVRNFIAVVIDHNRIGSFAEIAAAFTAIAESKLGIHEAEITTAKALDESSRNVLEARVGALAGGKVNSTYKIDPTLLGGAVVRIGSTVYDGSVRGQLARLKQELVGA